jgi:hypothetical protein
MSEYGYDESEGGYPAVADAVAGNIDHLDTEYGYSEEPSPWQPEFAPDDPESPEEQEALAVFNEAARAYGIEHAQQIVGQLIDTELAPLGAEMEAALEQQRNAAGWEVADQILSEAGLDEADRERTLELADGFVEQFAANLGIEPGQWLEAFARYQGGSVEQAAQVVLQSAANVVRNEAQARGAADEVELARLHTRLPQPGGSIPPGGDEFSVVRKYGGVGT